VHVDVGAARSICYRTWCSSALHDTSYTAARADEPVARLEIASDNKPVASMVSPRLSLRGQWTHGHRPSENRMSLDLRAGDVADFDKSN